LRPGEKKYGRPCHFEIEAELVYPLGLDPEVERDGKEAGNVVAVGGKET
jgi:hypothetical protein